MLGLSLTWSDAMAGSPARGELVEPWCATTTIIGSFQLKQNNIIVVCMGIRLLSRVRKLTELHETSTVHCVRS